MSKPPKLKQKLPELRNYWDELGYKVPRYLTEEQVQVLENNQEYVNKTRNGTLCPVCLNTGSYTFNGEGFECFDDTYGHITLRLVRLYYLHNIPLQYQQLSWKDFPVKPKLYKEAKEGCDNYIELFQRYSLNGVGLTFYSRGLGSGKSWGATSVLKELVKLGYDGWFAPFYQVKSYYQIEDPKQRDYLIHRVQSAEDFSS